MLTYTRVQAAGRRLGEMAAQTEALSMQRCEVRCWIGTPLRGTTSGTAVLAHVT